MIFQILLILSSILYSMLWRMSHVCTKMLQKIDLLSLNSHQTRPIPADRMQLLFDRARSVASFFAAILVIRAHTYFIQWSIHCRYYFLTHGNTYSHHPSIFGLCDLKVCRQLQLPMLNGALTTRSTTRYRRLITSCSAWWRFFVRQSCLHDVL